MTSLCSMLLGLLTFSLKCQNVEMENVFDTTIIFHSELYSVLVGPCHHDMARPQVADRGTVSDKKGSCE